VLPSLTARGPHGGCLKERFVLYLLCVEFIRTAYCIHIVSNSYEQSIQTVKARHFELRDRVPSYGSAHELFTRCVTPCLSQKQRRGSPERTDEGYGDHLTRSLGSLTTQLGATQLEHNCPFLSKSEASAFEVSGYKNPINLTCQAY
jgi:hypothetical protein